MLQIIICYSYCLIWYTGSDSIPEDISQIWEQGQQLQLYIPIILFHIWFDWRKWFMECRLLTAFVITTSAMQLGCVQSLQITCQWK